MYIVCQKVKMYLVKSVDKLKIKELFKESRGRFRTHDRSMSVSATGPAVKVIMRQQITLCQRCCMLGQCSFRKSCCFTQCLREGTEIWLLLQLNIYAFIFSFLYLFGSAGWLTAGRFFFDSLGRIVCSCTTYLVRDSK